MSMTKWAEREIEAACKRENPNWDGKSFDYGCSCYQSALKAYKSLMDDGHSGFSFSVTKDILIKLMNNIPLSPITDEDFFSVERGTEEFPDESSEYLKERGLKSDLQCPRRSSLFRTETLDGKVSYHDIDRAYCINADNPSDTFSSGISKFIDELHPITMPYTPEKGKYKVYVRTFLTDKAHGDFDVHHIIGYEDPEGNWHDYDLFEYYGNNKCEVITDKYTQDKLKSKRIDTIEDKVVDHIYMLITDKYVDAYYSAYSNFEYKRRKEICKRVLEKYENELLQESKLFNRPDEHGINCINTWTNHRLVVNCDILKPLYIDGVDFTPLVVLVNKIKIEIEDRLNELD